MKYRSEIDGLRAVAVVPVILFHAGFESFSGGFVGVDVFFVISGYLITSIIIADMEDGKFSLLDFYERRARRILPALIFVVLCCIPAAWFLLFPRDMVDFAQSLLAVATFSSNILFWMESGYFDTAAELKPLLHTWSLAVEEQFYILFPLFLMAAWRFGRRAIVWTLVASFIASLSLAHWGAYNKPASTFFLLPTRAWELLIGSFAAFYLQRATVGTPPWLDNLLSAAGLAAILYSVLAFDAYTPFPSLYALLPTVGTVLIIVFAGRETLAHKLLSLPYVVGVGLISYSLYLWHQPVFAFWRHYTVSEPTHGQMLLLAASCFPLAYATYRFVEAPFRGRSPWLRQGGVFRTTGIALTGVFVLGYIGLRTDGIETLRSENPAIARYDMFQSLAEDRQTAIRAGICQFNERGKHPTLDGFLENWACTGLDDDASTPAVAIYGDSHAADKAVALRENGLDVTQLGGADCPLIPVRFGGPQMPYCDTLLERIVAEVSETTYDALLLSTRYSPREVEEDYVLAILEFWSTLETDVYLFSPMPERHNFDRIFSRNPSQAIGMPGDDSHASKFYAALEDVDLPGNIQVVDTEELFCSMAPDCASAIGLHPLLIDYGHLSVLGARLFGRELIERLDILHRADE